MSNFGKLYTELGFTTVFLSVLSAILAARIIEWTATAAINTYRIIKAKADAFDKKTKGKAE